MTAFAPIAGFPGGHYDAQCTVEVSSIASDSAGFAAYGTPTEIDDVPCRLVPANSEQLRANFRDEDRVGYMLHLPLTRPDTGAALAVTGQYRFVVGGVTYQARGPGMRHPDHQEVPVTEEAS